SWNTFIALNSPPGGDPANKIGRNGDNDTVWEHYRDVSDIFLPGGAKPTWDGPTQIPDVCKPVDKPGRAVVTHRGKNLLTSALVDLRARRQRAERRRRQEREPEVEVQLLRSEVQGLQGQSDSAAAVGPDQGQRVPQPDRADEPVQPADLRGERRRAQRRRAEA